MKTIFYIVLVLLVACSAPEETTYRTSASLDDAAVPGFLAALASGVDAGVDVDALTALTDAVSMDEEKQEKFEVRSQGRSTTLVYHVWREQADWVHVYLWSPSEDLIAMVEAELGRHRRAEEG